MFEEIVLILKWIMYLKGIIPVSRYRRADGVETGTFNFFLSTFYQSFQVLPLYFFDIIPCFYIPQYSIYEKRFS